MIKNQQTMAQSFIIDQAFVRKIELDVSSFAKLPLMTLPHVETSFCVDVEKCNSMNAERYRVEILVNVSSRVDENTSLFNLILNYSAIVGITDDSVSEDVALGKILKIQVPKFLLDSIRSIVWQVTLDAGFPFMISDDFFDYPEQNVDVLQPVSVMRNGGIVDTGIQFNQETPESEIINFQWLINDIESYEGGEECLDLYASQAGDDALSDYKRLPLYKYYYRFFEPIEFHHPNYNECDESVWLMLYQMLYGSMRAECKMIDMGEDLPEIQFTYTDSYVERTVSSLNMKEIKSLLSNLFLEALAVVAIHLLLLKGNDVDIQEYHSNGGYLISKQNYFSLFKKSVSSSGDSFLDRIYEKIEDCAFKTDLYRC